MPQSELDSRKDKIFGIIVHSYVETAEPVGSRTISKGRGVSLSPASIRNVMADLEDEGLIRQPHTSAGRIPTDRGYRYFVDRLMEPEGLTDEEKQWIEKELSSVRSLEGLTHKISKVVSTLTANAAIVYLKELRRASVLSQMLEQLAQAQHLMDYFEEEPGILIEGIFRIFEQPEFRDAAKMRILLQEFDEKEHLLEILDRDLQGEQTGVRVHIGEENSVDELGDVSLVMKDCSMGGVTIGGVAVVGPTRMRYQKAVSVVDYVADTVTEMMRRF